MLHNHIYFKVLPLHWDHNFIDIFASRTLIPPPKSYSIYSFIETQKCYKSPTQKLFSNERQTLKQEIKIEGSCEIKWVLKDIVHLKL